MENVDTVYKTWIEATEVESRPTTYSPDEKLHPTFMAYPGGDDHMNRGRERSERRRLKRPIKDR